MNRHVACFLLALLLHFSAFSNGMPPEENRMKEDYLPTPFSAGQIKEFCKPGYAARHLFENEGQKSVIQTVRFLESEDSSMARFSSRQESTTGELVTDDGILEVKWDALQAHASFPENITTVSEEDYVLDGKTYACWKYVVKNIVPTGKGTEVTPVEMNFWFAKDLPGPPIKMIQIVDGKKRISMTMITDKKCCEEAPCAKEPPVKEEESPAEEENPS